MQWVKSTVKHSGGNNEIQNWIPAANCLHPDQGEEALHSSKAFATLQLRICEFTLQPGNESIILKALKNYTQKVSVVLQSFEDNGFINGVSVIIAP